MDYEALVADIETSYLQHGACVEACGPGKIEVSLPAYFSKLGNLITAAQDRGFKAAYDDGTLILTPGVLPKKVQEPSKPKSHMSWCLLSSISSALVATVAAAITLRYRPDYFGN